MKNMSLYPLKIKHSYPTGLIRIWKTTALFTRIMIVSRSVLYFTGKTMMLKLFSKHFLEMTESVDLTVDITKLKIKNHNERKSRRIGFTMDNYVQSEENNESVQIAAKA